MTRLVAPKSCFFLGGGGGGYFLEIIGSITKPFCWFHGLFSGDSNRPFGESSF